MNKGLFIEPLMDEREATHTATAEEIARATSFPSLRRRQEYLTWRAVVRRELECVQIAYDPFGAPSLPDHPDIYIGVSHCEGWVAVCISDRRCAVDIEPADRNFRVVEARCMNPEEQALSRDPLFPAIVWCAKECLYKLAEQQQGLDFLADLRITAVDIPGGTVVGTIRGEAPVELSIAREHGLMVVYRL